MVVVSPIERMRRMTKPGSRPCGPRSAFLPYAGGTNQTYPNNKD